MHDIDAKFPGNIFVFKYYLEKNIEVDGDHHSHPALQMTANLCGDKEIFWQEAEAQLSKVCNTGFYCGMAFIIAYINKKY